MSDQPYREQVYTLLYKNFESSIVNVKYKLARGSDVNQSYIVPVEVDTQNQKQFSDTVKKLKDYLDLRFLADKNDESLKINSISKDNNATIDLVLPFKGRGNNFRKCTVRVYRLYASEIDDISKINAGIRYQADLINKMRSAGYTRQVKAEEGESGADLTLNVNGIEVRIEIKSPGSAYGSGQLEFKNFSSGWTVKPSNKQNPEFKEILSENTILPKLTENWKRIGFKPVTADKEAQKMLKDFKCKIDSKYIRQYYNKVHYVQYKNKGLFLINKNDNPLKLDIPLLHSNNCYFRARVQNSGGDRFKFVGELYAPRLVSYANQVSLDNDLDFLENLNN